MFDLERDVNGCFFALAAERLYAVLNTALNKNALIVNRVFREADNDIFLEICMLAAGTVIGGDIKNVLNLVELITASAGNRQNRKVVFALIAE